MAATASKPASRKPARKPSKPASGPAKKPRSAETAASRAGAETKGKRRSVTQAARDSGKRAAAAGSPKRAAAAAAKKLIGKAGKKALRTAAGVAGGAGRKALEAGLSKTAEGRPPIQAAVDVAAPLAVVWSEWMKFEAFTEGLHKIEDVEREDGELVGRTAGPERRDWRAEIVDEREQEAFAWRSVEGTDCAGLITFHRLSDRLTRIEADLDVMPTTPVEALLLPLRLPTRRAQRELQHFKAKVEFINPDVYEDDEDGEAAPEQQRDGGQTDAADEQGGN